MHINFQTFFSILTFICLTAPTFSAPASRVTVPMMSVRPVIDGKVSPEEQGAAVSADLQKITSLDAPRLATKVYIGATMEGLYVGFVGQDSNLSNLTSRAAVENGAVFDDDSFQVLLTPRMDTAADSYYHFAVNPNNVRYSSHIIERAPATGWTSAVSQEGSGNSGRWEAEFFIPLKTIGASQELPVWRANFARHRPARGEEPGETSAWVDPGISLHNFRKFGYLQMPRFVPDAPGGAINQTTPAAESAIQAPSTLATTATLTTTTTLATTMPVSSMEP